MKTSEKCPSPSQLRKLELQRLFWAAGFMQEFRERRGNAFCLNEPPAFDPAKLSICLFGDGPPIYESHPGRQIIYTSVAQWFANDCYVAFIAEGLVIVPPFLCPHISDRTCIPYFPEELACSASQ